MAKKDNQDFRRITWRRKKISEFLKNAIKVREFQFSKMKFKATEYYSCIHQTHGSPDNQIPFIRRN